MEDRSFLCMTMNLKMTPKWVWPGVEILGPPYNWEISQVNYRYINNNKTANIKDKNLKVYNDV